MAKARSVDARLARLREFRHQPPSPPLIEELGRALGDASNLVVAEAAQIAGDAHLLDLSPALVEAFDRFLVDGETTDKLCRAKLAVVEALNKMEFTEEEFYLRGFRTVQDEPAWGRSNDTAVPVRVASAFGLVRNHYRGILPLLVDMLSRPGKGRAGRSGPGPGPFRHGSGRPLAAPQGPAGRPGARGPFGMLHRHPRAGSGNRGAVCRGVPGRRGRGRPGSRPPGPGQLATAGSLPDPEVVRGAEYRHAAGGGPGGGGACCLAARDGLSPRAWSRPHLWTWLTQPSEPWPSIATIRACRPDRGRRGPERRSGPAGSVREAFSHAAVTYRRTRRRLAMRCPPGRRTVQRRRPRADGD